MKFFRMRLILALVVGITLVSVASTCIEVLTHNHAMREELRRRTAWQCKSLQSEMEKAMAGGQAAEIAAQAVRLRSQNEALGLGVYDLQGGLVTEAVLPGYSMHCRAARWTRLSGKALTQPFSATRAIGSGWKRRFH